MVLEFNVDLAVNKPHFSNFNESFYMYISFKGATSRMTYIGHLEKYLFQVRRHW